MTASRCCPESGWLRCASALAVLLGLVGQVHAEPEARAELTALLASGNLLGGPEPEAPPWEGLASPRSGAENRARLALSTSDVGFLPGVTTRAVLRLDLGLDGLAQPSAPALRDASSFVGVAWRATSSTTFDLKAFPFDTDYLRVGYLHALDWGGTDVARRESTFLRQTGGAPGVRLGIDARRLRLFLAAKWATATDALAGRRRLWGGLAGGSFGLGTSLTLDAGFGYFQRPAPASSFLEGASLRLVWHHRVAEPELAAEPFRPPSLREDTEQLEATAAPGLALAVEAVTLVAREQRFDSPNAQTLTAAPAGALYGSIRGRRLAAHAVFTWRSLAFVLRSDPRGAPGEGPPLRAVALPELTAWVGASISEAPFHLVPSFEAAVRLPAALETPSPLRGFTQTLVVGGGAAGFDALPVGAGRLPIFTARLGARFPASATVLLAVFSEYERNPNRTSFGAPGAAGLRSFVSPDALSAFCSALARF